MPDIYAYLDYRKFMAEYYEERKMANHGFSYQVMAEKAGFPNKGFLFNVIKGAKNVSAAKALRLAESMKLSRRETEYFQNLVAFNQASSHAERSCYFERLSNLKTTRPAAARIRQTRKDQYAYYARWYLSVIRALIDTHPFTGDYAKLAKMLYPPIKPKEAKKAVELLEKLELIKKGRGGRYQVTSKTITAGPEIVRLGMLNFQEQTTGLALKALRELPKEKRHISGLTLGICQKTYEAMCSEIEQLQEKLLAMAEQDEAADRVFQMNFHFFPVSKGI
jgi:uncharacterized protein (TIGR02147 family)